MGLPIVTSPPPLLRPGVGVAMSDTTRRGRRHDMPRFWLPCSTVSARWGVEQRSSVESTDNKAASLDVVQKDT